MPFCHCRGLIFESPCSKPQGIKLFAVIVYLIVYSVNNLLFVRFLKGNALSKQSYIHAFVKTNASQM
jgi:hypothetical protein